MKTRTSETKKLVIINKKTLGNIYLSVISDDLNIKQDTNFYFNQKPFSVKNTKLTITSFIFLPELFDYILNQLKATKIYSLGIYGNLRKLDLNKLNFIKTNKFNPKALDDCLKTEKTKEVYTYKFRLNTNMNNLLSIFSLKFNALDVEENYYIQKLIEPDKTVVFNVVGYGPATIAKLNNYFLDLELEPDSLKRIKCLYDNVPVEDQLGFSVSQSFFSESITKGLNTNDIKKTYLLIADTLKKYIFDSTYSIFPDLRIIRPQEGKITVIFKNPDKQTLIINKDTLELISMFDGQKTNKQIYCNLKQNYSFSEIDFIKNISKLVEEGILTTEKTNCSFGNVFISNMTKYPLQLISFETTKKCNLQCVHCYNNSSPNIISKEFTIRNYFLFLEKIKKLGVYELIFTGGEPLFRTKIKELFKIAHNFGFWYSIFTNGTLVTKDMLKFFLEYPPRQIIFSLDSVVDSEFKQIRGISPHIIMENIKQAKGQGFNIRVNVAIVRGINDKKRSLKKLLGFLQSLDITDIVMDSFEPIGRGKINSKYKILKVLSTIKMINSAYFDIFGKNYFDKNNVKKLNTYCGVAKDRLFILAKGDIALCSLLTDSANTIGNINMSIENLKDIWESNTLLEYIRNKQYLNKKCKSCDFVTYCYGGCIGKSWQKTKKYGLIDDWACKKMKYMFKKDNSEYIYKKLKNQ